MKLILIIIAIVSAQFTFGQRNKSEILWVENEDVVLQGTINSESRLLFVGQEYFFTMIVNEKSFDLEIKSENLEITLLPESKKSTGGLRYKVVPIDTGYCYIQLSVGRDKKRAASLLSNSYHASVFSMPPIFISNIRSGGIITELPVSAELSCNYGQGFGIYDTYPVKSWKAKLGNKEFSGEGKILSNELIDAVNQSLPNELLHIIVELEKNNTGFKFSESVFILK